MISPKGHKIHRMIHFGFQASKNEAEYEALVASLRLAKELQVHNLKVYSDSQLVVNQVNDIYQAKREKMVAYLEKTKQLMGSILMISIEVVPQSKNANVDALAKLAFMKDVELLDTVSVEFLVEPSIKQWPEVMKLEHEPSWIDPIIVYLKKRRATREQDKSLSLKVEGSSLCHLRQQAL